MSASKSQSGTQVLTLSEAAEYLRVPPAELDKLVAEGKVPARNIGGEWRFLRNALENWLGHAEPPFSKSWSFAANGSLDSPYAEELLLLLEKRLLQKLKQQQPTAPRPGSKEAVLKHFGGFHSDDDLEERLADARKRREAGG
jgi:excisionase family DNA binding protein